MLTLASLLADLGLEPEVDAGAAERRIRWVHISELEDPTPFLSGGELLLTTGINLTTAPRQRQLVRLLSERDAAGLGLGTGFDHGKLPAAMVEEARERELPLFEVPYEMPFIAITEKAFTKLVNDQFGVLERGIEVHALLEGLVLAERGLGEVMAAIAEAVGGGVLLLDDHGRELSRHPQERGLSPESSAAIRAEVSERAAAGRHALFVAERGPLKGRAVAVPVPIGGNGPRGHWLVAARRSGPVGELEMLIARQAAMVVALELMRERSVRDTERRLAGDVLAEALGGNLGPDEIRGRLQPFGIGGRVAVLLFDLGDHAADAESVDAALRANGVPALVAVNGAAGRPLLCAVVDPADRDPVELAREGLAVLGADGVAGVRAAASRPVPVATLRRAFHEARCALEATSLANGSAPDVGGGGGVRARAPPLARGVHRAQRAVGARRSRPLLPPPHPALPDPQDRGADRARSQPGAGPDRALARAPCTGAGPMKAKPLQTRRRGAE
jgi:purine catabolism regulator